MKILITIHGIRWSMKSDWQNNLGVYIKSSDPQIKVMHFRYGKVLGFMSWWMTVTRALSLPSFIYNHYIRKFNKFIRKIQKKHPTAEISVIAHSFGGWMTEQVIRNDEELRLDRIIFMHCPISAHIESTFFWNWLESLRVKKVFSWSSKNDMVIKRIAIKPFGQNGYWGFIRNDVSEDRNFPAYKPYPIELYNYRTNETHGGVLDNIKLYGDDIMNQVKGIEFDESKDGGLRDD